MNKDIILEKIKSLEVEERELVIPAYKSWNKEYKYLYFTESEDYIPKDYEDLVQIFYSTLNNGWKEFTFYCSEEYVTCLDDVAKLSYNQKFLAEMNNFVHPYNSYTTIKTLYDTTGEITLKVEKLYSDEDILKIDEDINKLIKNNTNDNMTTREKIKAMHDAIINSTKYDEERAKNNNSKYDSSRIQGVLYDHYAICSGYTDIMAVILNKLNVPNFKIASEGHVWNAVYLDDNWYHLDLTWDDPVLSSGKNILLHDYFLVNDKEMIRLDEIAKKNDHIYNKNIYLEFSQYEKNINN